MSESARGLIDPELVQSLLEFRRARNWEQFHTPKNLASAIAVEAGELLEHFVWDIGGDQAERISRSAAGIEAEIADVVILLTYLVHDLSIDVDSAVRAKLNANAAKYPVDKFHGSNRKYSDP